MQPAPLLKQARKGFFLLNMLHKVCVCARCCSTAGLVPSAGTGSRLLHRCWRPGRRPRRLRLCPQSRQTLYAGPGRWQPALFGLGSMGRARGVMTHEQQQCQHVHVAACTRSHISHCVNSPAREWHETASHLHSVGRRCAILGLQAQDGGVRHAWRRRGSGECSASGRPAGCQRDRCGAARGHDRDDRGRRHHERVAGHVPDGICGRRLHLQWVPRL